ncbi:MAG: double-strand break repair helicase AddA [Alphaproteobacteria bacterium]|nr:double-strand break repair helicase AddA [Alphaproteobacteria bacterium]
MTNLSPQQIIAQDVRDKQTAASDPHSSVWVSASAGSGKTKVLADRVARLLLEGVKPSRILCLTFTRAAAAEMSLRLNKRLANWAIIPDEELAQDLALLQNAPPTKSLQRKARRLFAQVLTSPVGLRILTIHGFAQDVLRRFPLEAGISPYFTVINELEAQKLWQETIGLVLEDFAAHPDTKAAQAFRALSQDFTENSLKQLFEELQKNERALCYPIKVKEALGFAKAETPQTLFQDFVADHAFARDGLTEMCRAILETGTPRTHDFANNALSWLALDEQARPEMFETYKNAFLTQKNEPRDNIKKFCEKDERFASIFQTETQRLLAFLERQESLQIAQQTEDLVTLGHHVTTALRQKKAAQGALDYDDLINKTLDLFKKKAIGPWVLFKLDGGIDHILVDESQDTSPAQWKIIAALAEDYFSGESAATQERTLFVVGDEKQSIYSFQGADPKVFAAMRLDLAKRIKDAKKPYEEVPLDTSFRSAPAILKAVDAVGLFPVKHEAFRDKAKGRVELWPIRKNTEEKTTERLKQPIPWDLPLGYETQSDPVRDLAVQLAQQIKSWVDRNFTVYDRALQKERPMNYGDVMVLVQRRKPFVDVFVRELKRSNIPVAGVDRMNLTGQLAVMDVLALAQFALFPQDDLNLATLLRSPFIGASEEDLMDLATKRQGSLWDHLATEPRFQVWHDYLHGFMQEAAGKTPLSFLTRILTAPCPTDNLSGRHALASRLGPDAQDPLDELLNAAELFETPSLEAFLHWAQTNIYEIKREMETAGNQVRITTVHAAKGLEAPVVILPDTTSTPSSKNLPKILWDREMPFYVPRAPLNPKLKALRDDAYKEQLEENKRLLYVALTRAADRLYICGWKTKAEKDESWYSIIRSKLEPLPQNPAAHDPENPVKPHVILADDPALPLAKEKEAEESRPAQAPAPPDWLTRPPPEESLPSRLIPSHQDEEASYAPESRFTRGRLAHLLLQKLPDLPPDQRKDAADHFLARHNWQDGEELRDQVLGLLEAPRFAKFFGPTSRAEQQIIGQSEGRPISGAIDRIAFLNDEIWIIDYKTDRQPPTDDDNIPTRYRKQMQAYKSVLSALYPKRNIRCALLWTHTLNLMEI